MAGYGHKYFMKSKSNADLKDMTSHNWRRWLYWQKGELKKLKRHFWKLCRLKCKQEIQKEINNEQ